MKATVCLINPSTGMIGARIDGYGDFIIFEIIEKCIIEKGDIVSHPDFRKMGRQTYSNITKKSSVNVYAQDICSETLALSQYKIK